MSGHLHDTLRVGDLVEARAPAGGFTIDAHAKRPAVLLAGGIGITPLLAMLRHLVYEGLRTRGIRPTTLVQAARSKEERPFDREVAELAAAAGSAVRVVRVLSAPGMRWRVSTTMSLAGSTWRCSPACCRSAITTSTSAVRRPSRRRSTTGCGT